MNNIAKRRGFLKNFLLFFLIVSSLPSFADQKLVFATHTRAPLSLYLQEVIQEALKTYSMKAEVLELPGSRVIAQVNSGQIDGDLSRVKEFKSISNNNASNYLLVNEPVVLIEIVMITLAHKKIGPSITWDTINQGKVAFLRGSKTIRLHLNQKNRVSLTSNQQALDLVANKRVDSAVMFASVAERLLSQSVELKEKLTIQKPAVMSFNLYIYLNKKHVQFIPKLELSLRQLKQNGFIERTARKYYLLKQPQQDVTLIETAIE